MSTSNPLAPVSFTALALILAVAMPACQGNADAQSADDAMAPSSDPAHAPRDTADGGDNGPKAPPVMGTPASSDLTDALGVFVSTHGRDADDGTHAHPLGTLKAAMDLAKQLGKRVYACSGTFKESLVLADSISLIGGLDCTDLSQWQTGGAATRIESPSSPAVRATNISSQTRLEGLDVVAPNAGDPSASSIGLLADHSPGLFLANSKITAGNGAAGAPGSDPVQLALGPTTAGGPTITAVRWCEQSSTCSTDGVSNVIKRPGAPGARGMCLGAPNHDGGNGGNGGSGGLWYVAHVPQIGLYQWGPYYYNGGSIAVADKGVPAPGTAGNDGSPGSDAPLLGALTADGYAPAAGGAGRDGAPGLGGSGGDGGWGTLPDKTTVALPDVWAGDSGPGGGAGGCPGLAGTAAGGGGASIALALVESPITIKDSTLLGGAGGSGGAGSFGSDPTPGGAAGTNLTGDARWAAQPGGRGGLSGVGTNGSNGHSFGVLHSGAAPVIVGSTKITAGQGAPAIGERSRTDAFGNTKTIPATAAGLVADIEAL